jgi:hypothetical protein
MTEAIAPVTGRVTEPPASGPRIGFLCIGAQKAGTSWLNEQLLRHPEVYLPPIKEVHFFNYLHSPVDRSWILDHYVRPARVHISAQLREGFWDTDWEQVAYYAGLVDRVRRGCVDERWYEDVFSLCHDPALLRGDITPAYLTLGPEAIEHVHRYNPGMRLVVLLREPVDRAVSAAKMVIKRKKIAQPDDAIWRSVISGHGIVPKSSYAGQLQNWLRVFSGEQLLVVPYERIAAEPKALLDEICDFLDITPMEHDAAMEERVHGGRRYDVPAWVLEWLESRLSPQRALVEDMYPFLARWWH